MFVHEAPCFELRIIEGRSTLLSRKSVVTGRREVDLLLKHAQAEQMLQEAVRFSTAQAAELPGVACVVEKESFLAPLLAGNAAPTLVARRHECLLVTMWLCHACMTTLPQVTICMRAPMQLLDFAH